MSPKSHLQIFNDVADQAAHTHESTFPLFSLLPKELRLKIWQHSLQRQRIIKVLLWPEKVFNEELPAIQDTEGAISCRKNERYRAYIDSYQVLSKLLRVSSEAREAALEFYRVHLPCLLKKGESFGGIPEATPGILYFNPEYDFLYITSMSSAEDTLIDFFYHLRITYDPHHIGLLNLAIDLNGLNANDLYLLQPSQLDTGVRTAFVETLTQLREVFLVSEQSVGRTIDKHSGIITSRAFFNRSLPILGSAPTFERLHRDPRPIAEDLKHMFLGLSDNRHVLQLWRQLLNNFSVCPSQVDYRFCLSFVPGGVATRIYDHRSAERWLQWEDDRWTGAWKTPADREEYDRSEKQGNFFSRTLGSLWNEKKERTWPLEGGRTEEYKNEDLTKAVKPAIGFWLFPVEMLDVEQSRQIEHCLFDVSAYWPELALSSLP